jgi:hypothetical protein
MCKYLAQRTVTQIENSKLQMLYYEQSETMLIGRFTSGLNGTPGRQVSCAMPKGMKEDLKVANTVDQATLQERRDRAIRVKTQGPEYRQTDRPHIS